MKRILYRFLTALMFTALLVSCNDDPISYGENMGGSGAGTENEVQYTGLLYMNMGTRDLTTLTETSLPYLGLGILDLTYSYDGATLLSATPSKSIAGVYVASGANYLSLAPQGYFEVANIDKGEEDVELSFGLALEKIILEDGVEPVSDDVADVDITTLIESGVWLYYKTSDIDDWTRLDVDCDQYYTPSEDGSLWGFFKVPFTTDMLANAEGLYLKIENYAADHNILIDDLTLISASSAEKPLVEADVTKYTNEAMTFVGTCADIRNVAYTEEQIIKAGFKYYPKGDVDSSIDVDVTDSYTADDGFTYFIDGLTEAEYNIQSYVVVEKMVDEVLTEVTYESEEILCTLREKPVIAVECVETTDVSLKVRVSATTADGEETLPITDWIVKEYGLQWVVKGSGANASSVTYPVGDDTFLLTDATSSYFEYTIEELDDNTIYEITGFVNIDDANGVISSEVVEFNTNVTAFEVGAIESRNYIIVGQESMFKFIVPHDADLDMDNIAIDFAEGAECEGLTIEHKVVAKDNGAFDGESRFEVVGTLAAMPTTGMIDFEFTRADNPSQPEKLRVAVYDASGAATIMSTYFPTTEVPFNSEFVTGYTFNDYTFLSTGLYISRKSAANLTPSFGVNIGTTPLTYISLARNTGYYTITDAENPEEAVYFEIPLPYGLNLTDVSVTSATQLRPAAKDPNNAYIDWRMRMSTDGVDYSAAPTAGGVVVINGSAISIKSGTATFATSIGRSDGKKLYFRLSPDNVDQSKVAQGGDYRVYYFNVTLGMGTLPTPEEDKDPTIALALTDGETEGATELALTTNVKYYTDYASQTIFDSGVEYRVASDDVAAPYTKQSFSSAAVVAADGSAAISGVISLLAEETTYQCRPYVQFTESDAVTYGDVVEFTTIRDGYLAPTFDDKMISTGRVQVGAESTFVFSIGHTGTVEADDLKLEFKDSSMTDLTIVESTESEEATTFAISGTLSEMPATGELQLTFTKSGVAETLRVAVYDAAGNVYLSLNDFAAEAQANPMFGTAETKYTSYTFSNGIVFTRETAAGGYMYVANAEGEQRFWKPVIVSDIDNPSESMTFKIALPYGVELDGESLTTTITMRCSGASGTIVPFRIMALEEGDGNLWQTTVAGGNDINITANGTGVFSYTPSFNTYTGRSDNRTVNFRISPSGVGISESDLGNRSYYISQFDLHIGDVEMPGTDEPDEPDVPAPTTPSIATSAAASVTTSSAALSATISNVEAANLAEYGFRFADTTGKASEAEYEWSNVAATLDGLTLTADLTELAEATTYCVQSYFKATGDEAVTYSTSSTFTTMSESGSGLAFATSAKYLYDICLTLSTTISNVTEINSCGVEYRLKSDVDGAYTDLAADTTPTITDGAVTFDTIIAEGLVAASEYEFRPYIVATDGGAKEYGNVVYFTTTAGVGYSAVTSDITSSSVTIAGSATNIVAEDVEEYGYRYRSYDGETPSAWSKVKLGVGAISFEGAILSDLTPATKYDIQVYVDKYNTDVIKFSGAYVITTLNSTPTISLEQLAVAAESITIKANIENLATEATFAECGVYYKVSGSDSSYTEAAYSDFANVAIGVDGTASFEVEVAGLTELTSYEFKPYMKLTGDEERIDSADEVLTIATISASYVAPSYSAVSSVGSLAVAESNSFTFSIEHSGSADLELTTESGLAIVKSTAAIVDGEYESVTIFEISGAIAEMPAYGVIPFTLTKSGVAETLRVAVYAADGSVSLMLNDFYDEANFNSEFVEGYTFNEYIC